MDPLLSASQNAVLQKYLTKEEKDWAQVCDRVCRFVASAESTLEKEEFWYQKFMSVLVPMKFIPSGSILANCNHGTGGLLNCFVLSPSDTMESITQTLHDSVMTTKFRGGVGVHIDSEGGTHYVRPKGSTYRDGSALGPCAVLDMVSECNAYLTTGNRARRGAFLFSMHWKHPDIWEFIQAKSESVIDAELAKRAMTGGVTNKEFMEAWGETHLSPNGKRKRRWHNANISVHLDDEFFDLLNKGSKIDEDYADVGGFDHVYRNGVLPDEATEAIAKARSLFDAIAEFAHRTADPGLLFVDNAKRHSPIRDYIVTTNPCFSAGTMVATRQGHFPIESLVGRDVEVWDGSRWVYVNNFRVTGENQKLLRVELNNGQTMDVTHYHKFILDNGDRVQAKDLEKGMKLQSSGKRVYGTIKAKAAYLKGFLLGDGAFDSNDHFPILHIHGDKVRCTPRLMASLGQLEAVDTVGVNNRVYGHKEPELRKTVNGQEFTVLSGLAGYKKELNPWVTTYRDRLPVEIYNWDIDSIAEFIAGYMDADGSSMDTKNGFAYQLSSTHLDCLKDFQLLLYSCGIKSKLKLMKKRGKKDFGEHRGGVCSRQDCYRITIPQSASVSICDFVSFSRLSDFSDKRVKHSMKDRGYRVESVKDAGIADEVYCCTVPESHSFLLTNGVITAQCGEVWLPQGSACNLGSLVMTKFLKTTEDGVSVDRRDLRKTTEIAVRFLDNVLTVSTFATEGQRHAVQDKFRQLGIGVLGWSDFIRELDVPYDSHAHLRLIDEYGELIADAAYRTSEALAAHRGACGIWQQIKDVETGNLFDDTKRARRNSTLLSIAPTGSISQLAGCSWAFEPDFGLVIHKQVFVDASKSEQQWVQMIHPSLEKLDLPEEDREIVLSTGSLQGTSFAQKHPEIAKLYLIAPEISPEWHLIVQASWQKWIDSSISKTINLPSTATVDEIKKTYLKANELGMKGITIYRSGTLESEPIKVGARETEGDDQTMIEQLPDGNQVEGKTYEAGCKGGICSL